jgi:uncharacterized membrane protein YgcG
MRFMAMPPGDLQGKLQRARNAKAPELSMLMQSVKLIKENTMAKGSSGGGKGNSGKGATGGNSGGGKTSGRGYGPPGGWPSTVPHVPSGGGRGNAAPAKGK